MSYANGTVHYNLPQTVGSDKRDWFDTNQAFRDVDEALWGAKESAESAAGQVTTLGERVTDVENDVADIKQDIITVEGNISGLQTAVTNLGNEINAMDEDITDAICAIKEADATADYVHNIGDYFWYNDTLYIATVKINVGAQIVPNTNCKTTTVSTELIALREEQPTTISITADASETVGQFLARLENLIDYSKLTDKSKLHSSIGYTYYCGYHKGSAREVQFINMGYNTITLVFDVISLKPSDSRWMRAQASSMEAQNISSESATGLTLTLEY